MVCGERALPCPGGRVSRFTASLILQCPSSSGKSRKLKPSPAQPPRTFSGNISVPVRLRSLNDERHSVGVALAQHLRGHWPPPFLPSAVGPPFLLGSRLACVSLVGGGSCSGAYLWLTFGPVSLFITGTLYKAICVPFLLLFAFINLRHQLLHLLPEFWSPRFIFLQKFITATALPLALRTIMCAPARHNHPPDRRPANPAGLARPLIDPVFKLKEPAHPFRIHII